MIAATGIVFSKQPIDIEKSKIRQKWRVDEVDFSWLKQS